MSVRPTVHTKQHTHAHFKHRNGLALAAVHSHPLQELFLKMGAVPIPSILRYNLL